MKKKLKMEKIAVFLKEKSLKIENLWKKQLSTPLPWVVTEFVFNSNVGLSIRI